jgi:hypothetical protein
MSDSALSVQHRKLPYQAQSGIADHGYPTKCPPMELCILDILLVGILYCRKFVVFNFAIRKIEILLGTLVGWNSVLTPGNSSAVGNSKDDQCRLHNP